MSHYKTNLRDVEFNLFEAYRIQDYLHEPPYEAIDEDTARHILIEVDRLSREEFAASFTEADRTKLELKDGEVALPPGVRASLDAFYDGGWHMLSMPPELGGVGAPPSLQWAAQELLVGANPAAYFYVVGPVISHILLEVGTPEQVERFAKPLLENRWGSTMVLTEPDAGSDVGAGTTRATQIDDDLYTIEGVKRFITSGEHDYGDNIIHLVLARPEGAAPGTKGLSLFIVPKYMVEDDGSLGERNGVFATNLEDKMGIRGSTTTELTFGQDQPCHGYLVGNTHDGIRQMFHVIEYARMLIGTKSAATLSTAYLNALEYAKERVQGPDLAKAADKSSPRVRIIEHPDVRRLLMTQKAHAEGMRALLNFTGWVQDQSHVHADEAERWTRLDDLLLPLVKGYSSEKGFELLAQSLQLFGGSGYLRDYPMEQYLRDAKIDTIYEGTTAIQGLDLFFRKIARDQGETITWLGEMIAETIKGGGGDDVLAVERELLDTAQKDVQGQMAVMVGGLMSSQEETANVYKVGFQTSSLLEGVAELVIGWLLIRHAEIALEAMDGADERDRAFYEGKVASARFFARHVLPKAERRRQQAETEDGALMDLAEESF